MPAGGGGGWAPAHSLGGATWASSTSASEALSGIARAVLHLSIPSGHWHCAKLLSLTGLPCKVCV